MISYSSEAGVPAALVEERDACGVGFIASLNNRYSHSVLDQALKACECMEHRGATSVDNISGDGAGVLTAIPWKLFKNIVPDPASALNADGSTATAVAMIFLPQNEKEEADITERIYTILQKNGFLFLGWRDVPVNPSVLGSLSGNFVPKIKQFVVQPLPETKAENRLALEKRIYETRREIQGYFRKIKSRDGYICSFSTQTIVYKGMLRSCDLKSFYADLTNPQFETNFAIYHRRFSTNTVPKWYLAQPMRLLAHNGEINTLLGNINWVKSRQYAYKLANPSTIDEEFVKGPLVDVGRSDSANLDSILESFVRAGYTPEEALMILVPEAFEAKKGSTSNNDNVNAFYKYHESLQEAWDGPALLVFSDGQLVGATLDRNGLRPARYMVTEDSESKEKLVHLMSEVGVSKILQQFNNSTDSSASSSVKLIDSGRLGPGEMLTVNIPQGKLLLNDDVKTEVAKRQDYKSMLRNTVSELKAQSFLKDQEDYLSAYLPESEKAAILPTLPRKDSAPLSESIDLEKFITLQTMFGWGSEDVELQIASMASESNEATFCMGDDCPLAALSPLPHTLYDYFKQRFAQVTNPPIDPLREGAVMSLSMFLGPKGDPLSMEPQSDVRVKIPSPILNIEELNDVSQEKGIRFQTISTLYPLKKAETAGGLKAQLEELCRTAVEAVKNGVNVINLSDHELHNIDQFSEEKIFVPPLLAVGAVHHALIKNGLRTKASLIVTTGQAWSTHHYACLVGYGASAVVPYLAYDNVINWHSQKRNQAAMGRGSLPAITVEKALYNYRKAVEKGLLKILSKMGISLLSSYHGAQIFEALGLSDEVVRTAFKGTASRIGGMTLDEVAKETVDFYYRANPLSVTAMANSISESSTSEANSQKKLVNYGFYNYMKSGEYHHNNQPLIKDILHAAIRSKDVDLFDLYEKTVQARPPTALRDCLEFVTDERPPIPLEEVENVESVMKRFVTGGMSLGALSREAHETLAIGMNRIGARSNSGEGGEDPVRFDEIQDVDEATGLSKKFPYLKGLKNGDLASSRIKQIASGRFGVTAAYLMAAEQLEIKIAQGAKPGEGGQLPAGKIDAYIASLRKSKPGITLISPPPHHDIYSIEDLAQLIHDLHQVNPKSQVSVKLVSEEGIGTVASGVAKAGADIIHISGHDGGTGASPASSIKHAGAPWELGLVESHTALRKNGLRNRVLLRADGGLKSGYDVVMAAAMGAEEFGFGTIALIAEGCIMARICHTNKCPVGVTTQSEELRKRFKGTPDNIVTFFSYIAEEVRHILARLGYRSLDEIIGRPGLLQPRKGLSLVKTSHLNTSYLIDSIASAASSEDLFNRGEDNRSWLNHNWPDHNGFTFDDRVLANAGFRQALQEGKDFTLNSNIINTDRSALGRVAGQIARHFGDHGFPANLHFHLTGASGQSFGVWVCGGLSVNLIGYANDYVGKGMSGGKIVIRPPEEDLIAMKQHHKQGNTLSYSIVGNTVLYGATGGELFVRGKGGERFAVRNSGAVAVVESLGYHGCEYMTGGLVLVLGKIGFNFGAGMTGGLAFIFPHEEILDSTYLDSPSSVSEPLALHSSLNSIKDFISTDVSILSLNASYSQASEYLQSLLRRHYQETQSHRAKYLLDNFASLFPSFVVVVPNSERKNSLLQVNHEVSDDLLAGDRQSLDHTHSEPLVEKKPALGDAVSVK